MVEKHIDSIAEMDATLFATSKEISEATEEPKQDTGDEAITSTTDESPLLVQEVRCITL